MKPLKKVKIYYFLRQEEWGKPQLSITSKIALQKTTIACMLIRKM